MRRDCSPVFAEGNEKKRPGPRRDDGPPNDGKSSEIQRETGMIRT